MPSDPEDLESYWEDVRAKIAHGIPKTPTTEALLETATRHTAQSLGKYINEKWADHPASGEVLGDITAKGIQLFIETLLTHLRVQTMTTLFEIILEGQRLSADELKGFVRALPLGVIERAVREGSFGEATGIHALLAVEYHHRMSGDRDYMLSNTGEGLQVTTYPARLGGKTLSFKLDERFQADPSRSGVDPTVTETR
jgi:hypothetical protein